MIVATGGVSGRKKLSRVCQDFEDFFRHRLAHSADRAPNRQTTSGKRAIVVVAPCTSGHDIALELTNAGATSPLIQRAPTVPSSTLICQP